MQADVIRVVVTLPQPILLQNLYIEIRTLKLCNENAIFGDILLAA